MKPVIGLMCQNELPWLRLLIPLLRETGIDIIAIDGGSTDGSIDYLCECVNVAITWHSFDTPGKQQNRLIKYAERLGYDALFKIDPDELMWPKHIASAFRLLETHSHINALAFPRYNFIGDRYHYAPCQPYYPDAQLRCYRLNEGARYPQDYHSGLNLGELGWKWQNDCTTPLEARNVLTLQHMHIYHYGETKPRAERILQYMNYQRRTGGLEPLTVLPDDHPIGTPPFNIRFEGKQPIDPELAYEVLHETTDRIPAHP